MILCQVTPAVLRLLNYPPADYMAASVAVGNTAATAYADDPERPSVAMIHESYTVLIGGDAAPEAIESAAEYLARAVLTPPVRKRLGGVKVLCGSSAWLDPVRAAFVDAQCDIASRSVLRYDAKAAPFSAQAAIRPIDRALMEDEAIAGRDMIAEEICEMWGSAEAFLNGGFGVCVVVDEGVAGFCTAEYLSPGLCGIGIATAPEHRRKGYALAMTEAFVAECMRRDILPHWECWTDNAGSMLTARRAGFVKLADYPAVHIRF